VHLASGVHHGPLVITRREVLVGDPGAVVRGGIVVRANGVTVKNVSVVGGENGIMVENVRNTVLDGVSVSGAKLDGIHVRLAGVVIKNCRVDMLGNPLGQGIDISFNMGMGKSMVDGCTVVGGMQGITTHSSMTEIMNNQVSRTSETGISVTEMSMGMAANNEVRNALGVGMNCNDRSMCTFERNTVVDTRPDVGSGNPSRRGIGVLASFQAEAELKDNELGANPVPMGAVTNALLERVR
jgi:parallel beta-helix repeat protein